jgi:hypothetical protein
MIRIASSAAVFSAAATMAVRLEFRLEFSASLVRKKTSRWAAAAMLRASSVFPVPGRP